LRNAQGEIPATLRTTDAVIDGVVSLAGKWWSQPEDQGAVSNMLSPSAWSPGGQPAFNEIFVEVIKAETEGRAAGTRTAAPVVSAPP
jgi:hypothetical protein